MSSSSHSSSTFRSPYSDNHHDCSCSKHRTGVITSCLDCFVGNGSLCRYEYGVNPVAFIAKLRGTCTMANSHPPEAVVHSAILLRHNGFGKYDVMKNNCENFALYCKTGLLVHGGEAGGGSGQASAALSAPLAVVLSLSLLGFVSSPVGFAAAVVATHAFNKYSADVGVRDDVRKVRVEEMAAIAEYHLRQHVGSLKWRYYERRPRQRPSTST